jgi:hypothetical protein
LGPREAIKNGLYSAQQGQAIPGCTTSLVFAEIKQPHYTPRNLAALAGGSQILRITKYVIKRIKSMATFLDFSDKTMCAWAQAILIN